MPTFTCIATITAPDANEASEIISECLESVQDAEDSGLLKAGDSIVFDEATEGACPVIGALQACARWMMANHKSHLPEYAHAIKALSDAGFNLHRGLFDEEPDPEPVYATREEAVRAIEGWLGHEGSYELAVEVYEYMTQQGVVTHNDTGFVIERDANVFQYAADLLERNKID